MLRNRSDKISPKKPPAATPTQHEAIITDKRTGERWNKIPTATNEADTPNLLNASLNGPSAAKITNLR